MAELTDIRGIGKRNLDQLEQLGIKTVSDLVKADAGELIAKFPRATEWIATAKSLISDGAQALMTEQGVSEKQLVSVVIQKPSPLAGQECPPRVIMACNMLGIDPSTIEGYRDYGDRITVVARGFKETYSFDKK